MASFYFPRHITVDDRPIIIYPCMGLEKVFDRNKRECLEKHIRDIYGKHAELLIGQYHIVIMWNDGTDRMCDVWIFDKIESWGSGPFVDVKIFRNLEREESIGVSAGDGLIMLGRETELEERLRKSGKKLAEYILGERAHLPNDIKPIEDFYQK